MIFDPAGEGQADPVDLRGGARKPRRFIGWGTFFDFGDGNMRPNKAIDSKISTPLFHLPLGTIADGMPPISLPQRNLLRQVTWEMPSGQSIAREMGVPAAFRRRSQGALVLRPGPRAVHSALVLHSEGGRGDGRRPDLGPVGGRIVAEVFLGLLRADRNSYFNSDRDGRWKPTLRTRSGEVTGNFNMLDFLTFAGVDPTTRGQ